VNALINYFVDLCLLRATPQKLPASSALLKMSFAANLLVGALLVVGEQMGPFLAVAESLFELLLMLLVLQGGLRLSGHPERFVQTATAIMGSGALLGLIVLPLLGAGGAAQEDGSGGGLIGLLVLLLVIWSMLVLGHILRHAFDLKLAQGTVLGLLYTVLSYSLISSIFSLS
jgi:hypothetical protein